MKQTAAVLLLLLPGICTQAQISAPGLGKTHTALWMAAGLKQNLDSSGRVVSMTYIGNGRTSTPADFNPADRLAIWVFNQEFYFRLHRKWQLSAALSYRRQNEYREEAPFDAASPRYKNEIRAYIRLIRKINLAKHLDLALTLRQELRRFLGPHLTEPEENIQWRTRFRAQAIYRIDAAQRHQLTLSGEPLFSVSHKLLPHHTWTAFGYHESRFSFYYSFTPRNKKMTWSIGYMNDLIGTAHLSDVHYLAFDLTLKNPFGHAKKHSTAKHHS